MTGKCKPRAFDIDQVDDKLWHIATLGDLIQSYRPEHAGETMFGDTHRLAGAMVFEYACDVQQAINDWLDEQAKQPEKARES